MQQSDVFIVGNSSQKQKPNHNKTHASYEKKPSVGNYGLVGDLTDEGAKAQLTFGGRGGANAPTVNGAKSSVK